MISRSLLCLRITPSILRSFSTSQTHQNFKSGISLDKLYSSPLQSTDVKPTIPSNETAFGGYIPLDEVDISYMRSSGPGGQHVNKVNTKVDVRFLLKDAKWLPESMKENIMKKHSHMVTPSGYIIVRSDKTRTQQLNLADALDKLRAQLYSTVERPPVRPDHYTIEVHRRRAEKATRERLREKRIKSDVRQFRGAQ
ncbi:peptidyl-tRNA hydrolase ICT1, mitochondrial [Hyalella azteca]|uniref:Large ribosomal subunit protein mL62 n=1 Tax=Hyalella azteca TaxID=294128 RepID=A0A8B7N5D3_HYAAZ|nr:peptidyl-tRNA hydrolase ICT1, mitochondrial [Hyalella azteca]